MRKQVETQHTRPPRIAIHMLSWLLGPNRERDTDVKSNSALALLLLSGAGLFLRSYMSLTSVDFGVDPLGVTVLGFSTSAQSFPRAEDVSRYLSRVKDQVESPPEVESAALTPYEPFFGGGWDRWFWPVDRPAPAGRDEVESKRYVMVTSGYFRTMGIPMRTTRFLVRTLWANKS